MLKSVQKIMKSNRRHKLIINYNRRRACLANHPIQTVFKLIYSSQVKKESWLQLMKGNITIIDKNLSHY